MARERVAFQGLPARICWLGYGEREKLGLRFNEMVRSGELKAPIVIGRDHLDCGSVASPEPRDRSDEGRLRRRRRLADPERADQHGSGRDLGLVHHGGGVGIGYSLHAGMVVVADGTDAAAERLRSVLTTDPGMGVIRHVDAGYDEADRDRGETRHPHPDAEQALGNFGRRRYGTNRPAC